MIRALWVSENIFTAISLFFFSQGLFIFFLGDTYDSGPDKDSALLRLIFLLIYFISFTLLSVRWYQTLRFLKSTKSHWITFLIILAIISIFWSSLPDITFRKSIGLVGSTLFGLYFATAYTFDQQLKIMGWTFGISSILSLLFATLLPEYGIMNTEAIVGAWRGIYLHKNGLGEAMFISFLSFLFLVKRARKQFRQQLLFSIMCCLCVVILYFSESATSLISVVLIYGLVSTLKRLSIRSEASVFVLILALILLFLFSLMLSINLNEFLDANNKDITLSGRIPLWSSLWDFMKVKFWFGYGYGSFFSSSHEETQLLWKLHTWKPVHAHNGLIQFWMYLGGIGCIVFIVGYLSAMAKALFHYLLSKDIRMLWYFCFMLYTIFFNFTEVSFFSINHLNWVLSLASIYSMDSILEHNKKEIE